MITAYVHGAPRPSDCVSDGVDVDIDVDIDGFALSGEVTLLRDEHSGEWSSWGDTDMWLSGSILQTLRQLSEDEYTQALKAIETAARKAIK